MAAAGQVVVVVGSVIVIIVIVRSNKPMQFHFHVSPKYPWTYLLYLTISVLDSFFEQHLYGPQLLFEN